MTDSFVQVAPDGTGKQIDAQQIGTLYRQTVTVGDPNVISSVQTVTALGQAQVVDQTVAELLQAILIELRVMNSQMNEEFKRGRTTESLESLRADEDMNLKTQ